MLMDAYSGSFRFRQFKALFELQIFQIQSRSFIAFEGGERAFDNVIISIEIKLLDRYLTLSDPATLLPSFCMKRLLDWTK